MSDPRVEAMVVDPRIAPAAKAIDAEVRMWPDPAPPGATWWGATMYDLARAALRDADAADPLLPKVRALYEAVRVYHFDPVTVPALPDLPPAGARVRRAFDAFTPDDLARLGVTRAGE